MAMAPENILPIVAPELADTDPYRIAGAVELAGGQVGQVFGAKRDTAIAYLAAHMLTIAKRDGAGGVVTSQREGDLAVSFGAVGGVVGMTELHTTSYGQEFVRLRRATVFGPRTRVTA
ncbi:DUF4054 domain-containing protein [Marinibaculum pumilum]|uniref:DUF4054 domain-containing protein n=1 Tax=Marinibaculum pumilum TaxID=1766165 RepID=A0ABV7KYG1_9PROT